MKTTKRHLREVVERVEHLRWQQLTTYDDARYLVRALKEVEAERDTLKAAIEQQSSLLHPAYQVFFRAGLLACREYMARFVEAQDPTIAMSIRANWWPSLGEDFGPPRKINFSELTVGEFGTASFRCKSADEVSPTLEALPIALGFLETAALAACVPPQT